MRQALSRLFEMILWFLFLLVNLFYSPIITIPYILTGKDFIKPIVDIHTKCLKFIK